MKVVTGETMQGMDRRTIAEVGIPGLTLMENAGRCCTDTIIETYRSGSRKAAIVAGKGNNGGDGFVIARLLAAQGWQVRVLILCRREDITGDAAVNLQRLDDSLLSFCTDAASLEGHGASLSDAAVIVDAILGTGLKSEVRGLYADAIDLLNRCPAPKFAVDIPSGIDSATGKVLGKAVHADLTVTFAAAKLGNVLYPGAEHCGRLKVADIGIPAMVLQEAPGYEFVNHDAAASMLRRRERQAHKGSCGHCLIVAGSTGKTGAAAMAANSAVRAGAGLVTVAVPAGVNRIIEVKTTEAMSLPIHDGGMGFLSETAYDDIIAAAAGKSVMAIGPGLSLQPSTESLVHRLVAGASLPLVIDADGLNALSSQPELLLQSQAPAIVLTPHPGEMARLAGMSVAEVESDRIGIARTFSVRYKVNLVLKGARTIIASPEGEIAINGSGNPGMASGGMGDVLTGVLSALIAQGYSPFTACRLAVYIHGHSADMVAARKGEIGLSAVDVQESLPYAFKSIATKQVSVQEEILC